MRCLFGKRGIKRLIKRTGLPVVKALTRGNTHHRIDMWLEDGRECSLYRNGEIIFEENKEEI